MVFQGETIACLVGAAGIAPLKREGDRVTPAGRFAIRRLLYRADRLPPPAVAGSLPREPIGPADLWCDDAAHAEYNRMVAAPFTGHAETLWRADALYDLVCVLGYNDAPVVRGMGSAIFLHVARADRGPTEGCVAVELAALRRLLASGLQGLDIAPD